VFVDVHNHVIPQAVIDVVAGDDAYGVRLADGKWRGQLAFPLEAEFYDPAAKLHRLDRAGIGAAVVSMAPPAYFYDRPAALGLRVWEAANAGLAGFCSHDPARLRWLAHLPMQQQDEAIAMYRKAVAAGCAGVAVATSIAGRRLDGEEYEGFWAVAEEQGLPVLVHPYFNEPHAALLSYYLQNVIGNPLETTLTVERLICAGVFERHPRLRLVLMHGGGFLPYQAGRLCHARGVRPELADSPTPAQIWRAFDQLYFDTITHDAAALRYLVERVGADHVVLGTDLPYDMGLHAPLDTLRAALPEAVVTRVAGDNPGRLFGIGSRQATETD
jgi:aminocarboxymuconate-semialdehyde decarboxylase